MKTKTIAVNILVTFGAILVVFAVGSAYAYDVSPVVLHLKATNKCVGCNLAGADLSGLNLAGAKLANAKLGNTKLGNTNLSFADMTNAKVQTADLKRANLSGATLSFADFWDADLSGANLTGAVLTGTKFAGAIWTNGERCNSTVGSSIGKCDLQPAPGNRDWGFRTKSATDSD